MTPYQQRLVYKIFAAKEQRMLKRLAKHLQLSEEDVLREAVLELNAFNFNE